MDFVAISTFHVLFIFLRTNSHKHNFVILRWYLEVRDAFLAYDKNLTGTIHTDKLIKVMRALGKNPTEDEIDDMKYDVYTDMDGKILLYRVFSTWYWGTAKIKRVRQFKGMRWIFFKNVHY